MQLDSRTRAWLTRDVTLYLHTCHPARLNTPHCYNLWSNQRPTSDFEQQSSADLSFNISLGSTSGTIFIWRRRMCAALARQWVHSRRLLIVEWVHSRRLPIIIGFARGDCPLSSGSLEATALYHRVRSWRLPVIVGFARGDCPLPSSSLEASSRIVGFSPILSTQRHTDHLGLPQTQLVDLWVPPTTVQLRFGYSAARRVHTYTTTWEHLGVISF